MLQEVALSDSKVGKEGREVIEGVIEIRTEDLEGAERGREVVKGLVEISY